jgi:hypothetical protein
MGIELTVIDHHTLYNGQITKASKKKDSNIKIPKARSRPGYVNLVNEHLQEDYDLVLTDSCPDSIAAAVIYGLGVDEFNIDCLSNSLTAEHIKELERDGVEKLLVLDKQPVSNGDLELFSKVTILNHTFYGLMSHRLNVSEVLYRAVDWESDLARDLNAIGIVSDYGLKGGMGTIKDVVGNYKKIFPKLAKRISEGTLNQHNIFDSKFKELSEMLQAPYILKDTKGVVELIDTILLNSEFTIPDLLNPRSRKKSVSYIRRMWKELNKTTEAEMQRFSERKEERGNLLVYSPKLQTEGFVKRLSRTLSDEYPGKVIAVKTKSDEGTGYILRKRKLKTPLPKVLKAIGVPFKGGLDRVVRCVVEDPKDFEEELETRLNS